MKYNNNLYWQKSVQKIEICDMIMMYDKIITVCGGV